VQSPAAPSAVSPARTAAAAALARVFAAGAFASAALDAELARAGVDARDAALATELVYGVLRTEVTLDDRLATLAGRRAWAKELGAEGRAHVLMAAYSLSFLDRVPAFAAVSEAVAGARAAGGERVAGFANAVLRRLSAEVAAKRPALADAIVASAPGWLRGALRRSLGRAGAAAYLAAGPVPPPIGLCLSHAEERAAWIDALRRAAPGATIEAGKVSPRAVLVRGAGDVRRLPGAGEAWIIQEEGAQAVALVAGARPGECVLDACAGHGNKTWLLAREVGSAGAVDAADLHADKLAQLRAGPAGASTRATYAVDWTAGAGDVPEGYDLVVVDAPCSGVGTLRRRPEIARTRAEADLARLAALQATIARRAATRARDGGRLVYAVCSVLREEGEEVAARLAEGDELGVRLEAAPFEGGIGRALAGEGHAVRLTPHEHGTDGYFVASFVVRRQRDL
jgi:16S rRNA (cytosine967-C5)-methyltransferase